MRTASQLPLVTGHTHPNPLASHAPATPTATATAAAMNGTAQPSQLPHARPAAGSSRPNTAVAANASPASEIDDPMPPARPTSTGPQSARPGFARAKSDFGPRHAVLPSEAAEEGSVDGHFKIRHGWDDQLNSEEYSNLLTSVR